MISPNQARLTLELNQTEMSAAMGVHRNTWLKWERGEQQMSAAPARLLKTLLWLQANSMLKQYLSFFSACSAACP